MDAHASTRVLSTEFAPAKVSVVISNYNYGRYLEACVRSVSSQSYDNIECIIIDDASTDDSPSVIDKIQQKNPDILVHKRSANGGQSAALLDGFSRTSGQFVVFLDADDVLLPNAIASHVYVHQCLRFSVGFTCSDMLQLADNTFVLTGSQAVNAYIVEHGNKYRLEPRPALAQTIPRPDDVCAEILNNIYLVDDSYKAWAWSATSAIMFRRDALKLWVETPGLEKLRHSTDAFFCYGINAICGSALIDIPLTAYRIHGRNGFAARLPLNRVRTYEFGGQGGNRTREALELLLHQAKVNKSFYRKLFWSGPQYQAMLSYLDGCLYNMKRSIFKDRHAFDWLSFATERLH